MDIPQQLISVDSLATFGGISATVVAVTNSVKNAFGWNPPWVALVLAVAVCVIGAFSKQPRPNAAGVLIAVVNGCIVYSSALGMNSLGTAASKKVGGPAAGVAAGIGGARRLERRFFTPWL